MTLLSGFENVSSEQGPGRSNMCDHIHRQVPFTGRLDGTIYR